MNHPIIDSVGLLIAWNVEDKEEAKVTRVIQIHSRREYVALFDVYARKALPQIMPCEEVEAALEAKLAHLITNDPLKLTTPDNEQHIQHRDKAYETIRELVEERHEELLYKDSREKLVTEAA